MKQGLLLINLGTPDNPSNVAVRRYLREFLSDKRVLTLPTFFRYLLLYGFILPLRTKQSAHAYQQIWRKEGSPLLYHSRRLVNKLQARLGVSCQVALGMRYGKPTLEEALLSLAECDELTILPLYPQYSSAATGSSIERVMDILGSKNIIPSIRIIRDFYSYEDYIKAQASLIEPYTRTHDFILFSYHGIPESHLHDAGCTIICNNNCSSLLPIPACYRAQCFRTTELIANHLGLDKHQYGSAFQSRLGRTPWVKPYTDAILPDLIAKGIKNLAIVCPSFVADCLETLEEIGIRTQRVWKMLGGETFNLIPCLNEEDKWIDSIITLAGLKNRI